MQNINYKSFSEEEFLNKLRELQELYTNSESPITDQEFDFLKEFYEEKFNTIFEEIGAQVKEEHGNKIKLPYYMPSLKKIKGKDALKELTNWLKKYPGEKIIEDKCDGFSLQYISTRDGVQSFTRGDSTYGRNMNHLLPYLDLPKSKKYDIAVRGEIILSKEVFNEYVKSQKDSYKKLTSQRSVSNGFSTGVNNIDYDLLKQASFVAYQIFNIKNRKTEEELELTPSEQLDFLEKLKFKTVWSTKINEEDPEKFLEKLYEILKIRENESEFDVDGLVIIDNNIHNQTEEEINRKQNPKYSLSFKFDKMAEVYVTGMEWSCRSKTGTLKPVILIDPILLSGASICRINGHNARYILDNRIGIGSKILITRSGGVIPNCVSVIEKSKSKNMVYPDLEDDEYEWDKNEVEFVLIEPENSENVAKAKIIYFAKHLVIKTLGESTIDTLFDAGFNTLKKF